MKEDVLTKLKKLPIPQDVSIEGLRLLLEILNQHPEGAKNPELADAYHYLRLLGVESPENINTKYLGILVSGWIEERGKNRIHVEKEGVASTTGGDLKGQIEDYEKRRAQNEKIRADIKKDTANVLDRKQKIAEEQRRIQEEIRKAKEAETKTKGKKVYATVETKNKYQVDENTQNAHEALKSETIDSLSKKIEEQLADNNVQTEDKREREVLARSIAVGIVAQVSNPNLEHSIKAKVLETVGSSNIFENFAENDLIETAKKGSISLAINERSLVTLGRQTIKHLYGDAVSEMIYGPEVIIVSLSPNQQQSSNYEIDVQAISTNYERLLTKQSQALEDVTKSKTPETTLITRVINYSKEKEEGIKEVKKQSSETEKIKELIEKFRLKKAPKSLFLVGVEANPWVEKVLNNNTALNTLSEETTRPNIASSIITVISKSLFTKAATSVVTKTATKEVAAVVLGGLNPLQTALVWLGAEVLSKIQQWIKKNPEAAALIFGGLAFFGALPWFGPLIALGIASVIVAGTIGVGVTTAAVFGTLNLIRFVWSRIIISLAGPMIVVFVVIPILTAFTLFIINSGAYVVPPSPYSSSLNGVADNPYMLVTKTPNPSKLDNSNSNQTVIYVVTVKALKGNLTNVNLVSAECKVTKKDKSQIDCPTEFLPEINNETIAPNEPKLFSFTGIYGPEYADSLIYDKVTFSATNEAGEKVTTSGSASVCIGDCPVDCLKIEGNWPSSSKKNMEDAKNYILSNNREYIEKVCAQYPNGLPLQYGGSNGNLWGYFKGTYLLFYSKGLGSVNDAIYVLSHELLHALVSDSRAIAIYLQYIATPGILSETPRCFYSYASPLLEERLAESVAFSIMPNRYCSITGSNSNMSQWPKHRDFVLNNILK